MMQTQAQSQDNLNVNTSLDHPSILANTVAGGRQRQDNFNQNPYSNSVQKVLNRRHSQGTTSSLSSKEALERAIINATTTSHKKKPSRRHFYQSVVDSETGRKVVRPSASTYK